MLAFRSMIRMMRNKKVRSVMRLDTSVEQKILIWSVIFIFLLCAFFDDGDRSPLIDSPDGDNSSLVDFPSSFGLSGKQEYIVHREIYDRNGRLVKDEEGILSPLHTNEYGETVFSYSR